MQRDKTKVAAAPFRLSWPAVFGGMFAATAVWLTLHVFGLAVGLSQLRPDDPSRLRALGIGSGIWLVLATMIALFAGGVVTARSAGLLGRSNAALHGIVLWGVTTVGSLVLTAGVLGAIANEVSMVRVEVATLSQPAAGSGAAAQATDPQRQPGTMAAADEAQDVRRAAVIGARAFWASFLMLMLSLLSSVLGALAGVTPRQRMLSAQAAEAAWPPAPAQTTARPVDVY